MRSKRAVVVVAAASAVVAMLSAALLGFGPVVFRLHGSVDDETALFVLNPFRNRDPERQPEAVLREVSAGNCQVAFVRLFGQPSSECAEDTRLHIVSWKLRAREDIDPTDVMLQYRVTRDPGAGNRRRYIDDPYWFRVGRRPDGKWRIKTVERWF